MKRHVTTADVFAILLPALAAVAGTWHLVYNHNDNPLDRTAAEIGLLYAMYSGGYLFWATIARAVGAASVGAATSTLFVIGMFWWVSAALGPLLVPALGVTSLGGIVAATAWAAHVGRTPDEDLPSIPARGMPAPSGVDMAGLAIPAAIVIALALMTDLEGGVGGVVALESWALILEYAGFVGGFLFWRLQTRPVSHHLFVPAATLAVSCILLGATSLFGVIVLVVSVGMPAAGAAAAGLVAELTEDNDTPAPVH